MSKAVIKMAGLALMAVSVFMILFGLYLPLDGIAGAVFILAWAGAVVLLVGFILHVIIRKD